MVNLLESEITKKILEELSEKELTKSELLERTSANSEQVISNYISKMKKYGLVNIGSGKESEDSNQKLATYVLGKRGFRFLKILREIKSKEQQAERFL